MVRFLLFFLLTLQLFGAQKEDSSKIKLTLEASLYQPSPTGTIQNIDGISDFKEDFAYTQTTASLFSLALELDYDYVPNVKISYFNVEDKQDSTLDRNISIAGDTFGSDVSTILKYQVFSGLLYQDFKIKGKVTSFAGIKRIYTGDIEFDIGIDTKVIDWSYEVQDLTNLTKPPSWIKVSEFIALPYIGIKYYFYDLKLQANVSAISLNNAKSSSMRVGADYRLVGGVYLTAGYVYDHFEAVEESDTVVFKTAGYKFGFKYRF